MTMIQNKYYVVRTVQIEVKMVNIVFLRTNNFEYITTNKSIYFYLCPFMNISDLVIMRIRTLMSLRKLTSPDSPPTWPCPWTYRAIPWCWSPAWWCPHVSPRCLPTSVLPRRYPWWCPGQWKCSRICENRVRNGLSFNKDLFLNEIFTFYWFFTGPLPLCYKHPVFGLPTIPGGTIYWEGVGSEQGHGIPYGIYDFSWSRSENPDHVT